MLWLLLAHVTGVTGLSSGRVWREQLRVWLAFVGGIKGPQRLAQSPAVRRTMASLLTEADSGVQQGALVCLKVSCAADAKLGIPLLPAGLWHCAPHVTARLLDTVASAMLVSPYSMLTRDSQIVLLSDLSCAACSLCAIVLVAASCCQM